VGTNLFVEGFPSPIVLAITLPRDARGFREISEIAQALSEVETTLRGPWAKTWPSYDRRRHRDVWLLRFRVESPSFFEILTDPAWLAVFLALLTGYKQGKESAKEISADASRLFAGIRGLSERQIELLMIAVSLTLERWRGLVEKENMRLAQRFRRVRNRLLGDGEEVPTIVVKDIDNKNRPW
jgi:hypothetical protein